MFLIQEDLRSSHSISCLWYIFGYHVVKMCNIRCPDTWIWQWSRPFIVPKCSWFRKIWGHHCLYWRSCTLKISPSINYLWYIFRYCVVKISKIRCPDTWNWQWNGHFIVQKCSWFRKIWGHHCPYWRSCTLKIHLL